MKFVLHYLEMLVAMVVGMVVVTLCGLPLERPDIAALVMATTMTIGMTVWMAIRRHHGIVAMALAMYVPFLLLLVPYWFGAISGDVLLGGGHMLMLPAMAIAMVTTHQRNRAETVRAGA